MAARPAPPARPKPALPAKQLPTLPPKLDARDIVFAQFDYDGQAGDSAYLKLARGDRIEVLKKPDGGVAGWWTGRVIASGAEGKFPSNFTCDAVEWERIQREDEAEAEAAAAEATLDEIGQHLANDSNGHYPPHNNNNHSAVTSSTSSGTPRSPLNRTATLVGSSSSPAGSSFGPGSSSSPRTSPMPVTTSGPPKPFIKRANTSAVITTSTSGPSPLASPVAGGIL